MLMLDDELFKCKFCQKTLNDPRILPCGESICSTCVPAGCKRLKCKSCHEKHPVPQKGFVANKCLAKSLESTLDSEDLKPRFKEYQLQVKDITSKMDRIQNLCAQSEISNYCSNLINQIDLQYEYTVQRISDLRHKLIQDARAYEHTCNVKLLENKNTIETNLQNLREISGKIRTKCQKNIFSKQEINEIEMLKIKFDDQEKKLMKNIFFHSSFNYLLPEQKINDDFLGKLSLKVGKQFTPEKFEQFTITVIPCWGTRALIPKVICEVHAQTLTPS
ncbi:hypothetical protein BpHYR1_041405, partial [Brachionus plicatilis]